MKTWPQSDEIVVVWINYTDAKLIIDRLGQKSITVEND